MKKMMIVALLTFMNSFAFAYDSSYVVLCDHSIDQLNSKLEKLLVNHKIISVSAPALNSGFICLTVNFRPLLSPY
jgi:hypothetical protein